MEVLFAIFYFRITSEFPEEVIAIRSDDHHGKNYNQEYDVSIDPGPQNT